MLPFADILALAAPAQQQATSRSPKIGPQERTYDAKAAPPPPGPKSPIEGTPLGITFTDVAAQSGLTLPTIYGGRFTNKYLLETTGCGLAFYDYDNDGWQDLFLVNGWRLEGFPAGSKPRAATSSRTTATAPSPTSPWAPASSTKPAGARPAASATTTTTATTTSSSPTTARTSSTATTATAPSPTSPSKSGLLQPGPKIRWNTGCTFVDYDRDGHLDLFVANYVDFDLKTAPLPEDGPCTYKGMLVACGPPGLPGGKNILYHNDGKGIFTDVSEKSGMFTAVGTYGLSVCASDLDGDGWPDIYVANDSAPATLYQNQHDGTFIDIAIEAGAALSAEAKPQAGMGVSIGDYNNNGNMDIVKTNFAGDTDSLYTNLGKAVFEDHTYPSGLGENTRLLGWGVGFFDMDNDGWLDILMSNGHVYPEVDKSKADLKYAEHKYLYRNLQNGRFEDVTDHGGPGILERAPARGCAFGDYNNNGSIDIAVNCINTVPQLLRCDSTLKRNWIKIKLVGVKSNRSGIGSKIILTANTTPNANKPLVQTDELRSGGSYFSQNDLRMHFGLDQAKKVDLVEIHWLSGQVDQLKNLDVNQLYVIQEGGKILHAGPLTPAKQRT